MQITIDIFFILLSLCAILLCAIFIAVLILLTKNKKSTNSGELKFLQEQLNFISQNLDSKLSGTQNILQKNLWDSLKNSQYISEISNKNIEAITKKLTELGETNREIKEIWDRLEGLEHILKNPKRRWNLWEYFLKELLENVFSSGQYQLQYWLSTLVVDAALFIWKKIIPIDSKFPQENYQYLIESEDEFSIKKYSSQLRKDIKNRIDETAKYILPEEETTDFAFMLIPAEGMYYDIFINQLGDISPSKLIEYWFSKKVIICSPSWFYAYLQTVLQGMKSLQIEEKAKEIQKYVLKLQKDIHSYEELYAKLWNSLGASVNHYNAWKKRLEIIDTDILKISPEAEKSLQILEEVPKPE